MLRGINFLLKYVWKFEKKYVAYNVINQLVNGGVIIADLVFPKFIIDELLGQRREQVCIFWIALLVGCNVFAKLLGSFFTGQCFALKGSVFVKFQAHLAQQLSRCDFSRLEDPKFLDIKEKANKFLFANGQGFGVVLDSAFNILGKLFVFAGIITILATLNLWIVLFFIALILLNAKYEARTRKEYVKWELEKAPVERRTSYLLDLIGNFFYGKEIRIFGIREWIMDKVQVHFGQSNQFYKKQVKELTKASYFSAFMNCILEGTAYVMLAFQVLRSYIGIGDFTMYVSAMLRFSGAMQDVMKSVLDIRQFSGYYEALEQYLNVPATMMEGKNIKIPLAFKKIEFYNVCFRYPGQSTDSLQNVNLTIKAGEKLAVVGENGAGKTTFIKLLCRLYDPTEGKILLDGIDIRDIAYDSYMKLVGAVFQDYKLFSFSLKENICFDQKNEEDGRIASMLEESGLENRLKTLEKGIYTSIYKNFDEAGFEPSGGEGQKIAITRAIYKDAPLILLDEPTSALDPRAEYELYQRFHEMVKGKTAVFISHRMSSTRFCDRILLLDHGRVAESGSHEQLMEKKGMYCQLFQMQACYYT